MKADRSGVRAEATMAAVVVSVLVAALAYGDVLNDYVCSEYGIPGCVTQYGCTSYSSQACDQAVGGYSASKKRTPVSYHACVSSAGWTCDQVQVLCAQELFWVAAGCTSTICYVNHIVTAGCELPE